MKKNAINVILSFLKAGVISFGGGKALIPVLEDQLVEKNKWMDSPSFDKAMATVSIAPASMPVALCAIWDSKYSLLSAYAYALPGPLIYLVLLTGFSLIGEAGMHYIGYASVGLISFVLFILYRFVRKNYRKCMGKAGAKAPYVIAITLSFLFTCGSTLKRLFVTLLGLPAEKWPSAIYSITMMDLIFVTFFVICFIGGSTSKPKIGAAALVAGLYVLSLGNIAILRGGTLAIGIGMAALAAASICYDAIVTRGTHGGRQAVKTDYKPLGNIAGYALLSVALVTAVYLASGDAGVWGFARKVVTSSLTAFGGGEAYYAISESVFVSNGIIAREFYDTYILGIVGVMPGPVLISIVTGIGYGYGDGLGGAVFGWMFGLLGFALAVAATALGALTLFMGFEALKNSVRLQLIVKYIIPVVCGMLISVAFSLMTQASWVLVREGVSPLLSLGIVASLVLGMIVASERYRINDIYLLLTGGAGTLTALSMLDAL